MSARTAVRSPAPGVQGQQQKEIPLLKRKDLSEGTIVRVDYPNRGRFLSAAGQHVTVKTSFQARRSSPGVFKKHGDRVEGRLIHVLEKSPLETRPPVCSIFPACGGCLYQTVPYGEQLKMKTDQVQRLLSSVTDEETVFDGIKEARRSLPTATRWNFPLAMQSRAARLHWASIKGYDLRCSDGSRLQNRPRGFYEDIERHA